MKRSLLGTSMIFVILVISFAGMEPSETLAQGTNASNATSAADGGHSNMG
jgi:hypothetical protein